MKSKILVFLACLLSVPAAQAWQQEGLRLRGRAQMRLNIEDNLQTGEWTDAFSLRRARVDGRWQAQDWLRLILELDLTERVEAKDIYARADLHPLLRVTAGQFKKPFSRRKLESPFKLLIPERGLLDRFAISDTFYGGYGGRDIGLMLSGRWDGPIKIRYFLGAFNNALDDEVYHRDYVARLQLRLFKGVTLAFSASHKLYDQAFSKPGELDYQLTARTSNLFGADLRWTLGNFRLDIEGAFGDNASTTQQLPDARDLTIITNAYGAGLYGVHAIASYRWQLCAAVQLTPAFMVEMFDPNRELADNTAIRIAAALNLDFGENLRVVLSAEGLLDQAVEYNAPSTIFVQLNLDF